MQTLNKHAEPGVCSVIARSCAFFVRELWVWAVLETICACNCEGAPNALTVNVLAILELPRLLHWKVQSGLISLARLCVCPALQPLLQQSGLMCFLFLSLVTGKHQP